MSKELDISARNNSLAEYVGGEGFRLESVRSFLIDVFLIMHPLYGILPGYCGIHNHFPI